MAIGSGFIEPDAEPKASDEESGAPMVAPLRQSVVVDADVARAFRLFTQELGSWWPVDTHSMAADREDGSTVSRVVFEDFVGGRVYEVASDGTEGTWAHIRVWDPPRRFVLAWKPNRREELPTEVEITFTEVDGRTRVDLEHRGWDLLDGRASDARAEYDSGWRIILRRAAARGQGLSHTET